MGGDGDNKNLILAVVLSMIVIFGWQMFFMPPPEEIAANGAPGTEASADATGAAGVPAVPAAGSAATTGSTAAPTTGATAAGQDPGEAVSTSPRVKINTPSLTGSIALTGARLDELHLSRYPQMLEPNSPPVVLLQPSDDAQPYFVDYGWRRTVGADPGPLPNASTPWTVESGDELTPDSPVVLSWDNGHGLVFRRIFTVDDRYMFTITQSVENDTGAAVELAPYGAIARRGEPKEVGHAGRLVHEGALGMFDGELDETSYKALLEEPANAAEHGPAKKVEVKTDGWLGFTDKYWMTTIAPSPGQSFAAVYRVPKVAGVEEYRTEARLPVLTIPAGGSTESVTHLFAGAKELKTVAGYEKSLGIDRFYDAIDWGWFYFITKPIAWLLNKIHGLLGNMGLAIIALTFLVKAVLFPLAYKSFVSMSKMKKLQPEMEKIKERVGDDKQKMQQEVMALYKKEKVNPAAGCLPIVLQIPIFFSLYKVLYVTIEMRHAPFFGWIRDLSAPDPTSVLNAFGLVPWDVPPFLHIFSIGVFPILMGITMWMQQKLNPAPTDQTQKMIFAWMPWVFMFMLGSFASGLVIYWCANNILTFTQQYLIMRSQGIEVDLLGNIQSGFKRPPLARKEASAAGSPAKPKDTAEGTAEDTAGDTTEAGAAEDDAGETPDRSATPKIPRGSGGGKSRRKRG